jgi:hypothetical protein
MDRNEASARTAGGGFVLAITLLAGSSMLAAGVWALASPQAFAEFAGFPSSPHFIHDAGAFQVGIGVTLLLALAWRDGPALALAGFLAANTVHAATRATARRLGGAEARRAAHLLARKYPGLHGVLVPFAHRTLRFKTGRTVHFELLPLDPSPARLTGPSDRVAATT